MPGVGGALNGSGSKPGAGVLTDIYTVPSGVPADKVARLKVVSCCNQSTATTVRLKYAPLGAADANTQFILCDVAISANQTILVEFENRGLPLSVGDVMRASSASGEVNFIPFAEVSDV